MKKNLILLIFNCIVVILIVLKLFNQVKHIEYKITEEGVSKEDIRQELEYEISRDGKSYSQKIDGKRVNNSEKMKEDVIVEDGLTLGNFRIEYEKSFTSIKGKLKNTSSEEKGGYYVYLKIYESEDEEIFPIRVYINKVQPNSELEFVTAVNTNVVDIYKCEIEKIEEENENE